MSERLVKARTKRGLTQGQMARAIGVTQGAVSLWESGQVVPSRQHITAVERGYGVRIAVADLLGAA